ncbi:hypothetical protein J6590_057733 [Homalodisca vitripennis]|nr:hypothetical protein J6590_057733 [Homalodisca vitripennis]
MSSLGRGQLSRPGPTLILYLSAFPPWPGPGPALYLHSSTKTGGICLLFVESLHTHLPGNPGHNRDAPGTDTSVSLDSVSTRLPVSYLISLLVPRPDPLESTSSDLRPLFRTPHYTLHVFCSSATEPRSWMPPDSLNLASVNEC